MIPLRAVRTAVLTAILVLALGAGVFALRDASDSGSVDAVAADVQAPKKSMDRVESDPPSPVAAPMPGTPVANVADNARVASGLNESRWDDGEVIDTGPFIDADDDAGDYASEPVSDVGEFLDPDAE